MKYNTGGFLSNIVIQKFLEVDKLRRWVICPKCKNVFETYQVNNCFCCKCGFEGDCETIVQTITS